MDVNDDNWQAVCTPVAIYARTRLKLPTTQVLCRRMPEDATVAAQQLFAVLRELDAQGVSHIGIETPTGQPGVGRRAGPAAEGLGWLTRVTFGRLVSTKKAPGSAPFFYKSLDNLP